MRTFLNTLLLFIFLTFLDANGKELEFLNGHNLDSCEKKLIELKLFGSPLVYNKEVTCKDHAFLIDLELIFEEDFTSAYSNLPSCTSRFSFWLNKIQNLSPNALFNTSSLQDSILLEAAISSTQQSMLLLQITEKLIHNNKFPKALTILYQVLDLTTPEKHQMLIKCLVYLKFINIFHVQKQEKKQLHYLTKLAETSKSINSVYFEAKSLSQFRRYHMSFEESLIDTAIWYESKALKLYDILGLSKKVASANNSKASIYSSTGNYIKSLQHYNQALSLYLSLKDSINASFVLNNMGNLYFEKKEFERALNYYKQATDILANQDPNNSNLYIFYYNQSEVYEGLGDFEKALHFYKLFDELEYEKLNEKNQKEIAQLQEEYEAAQKEQRIAQLNTKNELQVLQLEKSDAKRKFILAVGGAGLLLIISIGGGLILRKQKTVLRLRKNMAEKNHQLTSLTLKNETSTIAAMSVGQETERKRISKYLHDHIGNRLGAISMNLEKVTTKDESLMNFSANIKTALENSQLMTHELRKFSHELTDSTNASFNLSENLERLAQTFNISEDLLVEFMLVGDVRLHSHVAIELYRIAQEALTNALKYSQASSIQIKLVGNVSGIHLLVNDNGIGMVDVNKTKGNGNGFANMKERANVIHAHFNVTSEWQKGTAIEVIIPFQDSTT